MENESLESISLFIPEEIYLISEEKTLYAEKLIQTIPSTPTETKVEVVKADSHGAAAANPEIDEIQKEEVPPIPVKGGFTKGILILHEEAELMEGPMDMLSKLVNAVGHSMSEVGLVSSDNLAGRTMEEFQSLNAHIVLRFGRIKHPINALPAPPYQVFSENETEYLFADSLTVISEDQELKKKLWSSLKILFNLSTPKK